MSQVPKAKVLCAAKFCYCPARSWVLAQEAEIPGIPIPPSPWHRPPPPPSPLPAPFSTNPQAPLPSGGQVLCPFLPLQYYCLENALKGGAWQAIVHGGRKRIRRHLVTKQLKRIQEEIIFSFTGFKWTQNSTELIFASNPLLLHSCHKDPTL